MTHDFLSTLVILCSFALTFIVARTLSKVWRRKLGEKEDAKRRAGESRQVRRARERRGR